MPHIIFLTGASGSGKTTLVRALSQEASLAAVFLHFDSIGVPSEETMINVYGSGREWQRQMTLQWAKILAEQYNDKAFIIFEGQVDLAFIVEAFDAIKFDHYKIILIHCDSLTRHQRLHSERNQPELVNSVMDNWAEYLYKQAIAMHIPILDTTHKNLNETINWIKYNFL